MKLERLFLLLSVIGIIIILFISNFNKPIVTGEIKELKRSSVSIKIQIEKSNLEILLLNRTNLQEEINVGNKIEIYGSSQREINKTVIFVDKIVCLDCDDN